MTETKQRKPRKLYPLTSKYGLGGVALEKPVRRKQDAKALGITMWAVVFFPKVKGLGPAQLMPKGLMETLSATREGAIARFMDGLVNNKDHNWTKYSRAGWKARRVRVEDAA